MQLKYTFATALAAASVQAQENSTGSANLTSLLSGNQNLTALTALLTAYPDIVSTLSNATNITLLAPSNQALNSLNSSGTLTQLASQPGYIQALLSYHVLVGEFYAENITSTPAFPQTLLNNTDYSNVTGGQVVEARSEDNGVYFISGLKNNVSVSQANLNFTGGVVHVIDGVLTIPPNVSTVATEAGLTGLLGAVEATNLTSAVSNTPDLTIFAPNNAAFQNISSALGNLTVEQATSILEYHVINGTVAYSSTLSNGSVPTLGGGNVTITITDGEVFVNRARVINADILLKNGVLHVIDSVLNPNDTTAANSSSEAGGAYSGASSASSIPYTSNIPAPSSTNAALATSQSAVASGYATRTGAIGENSAGNPSATAARSSSSSAGAAMPTGAIGAAALFGGAAWVANW